MVPKGAKLSFTAQIASRGFLIWLSPRFWHGHPDCGLPAFWIFFYHKRTQERCDNANANTRSKNSSNGVTSYFRPGISRIGWTVIEAFLAGSAQPTSFIHLIAFNVLGYPT